MSVSLPTLREEWRRESRGRGQERGAGVTNRSRREGENVRDPL